MEGPRNGMLLPHDVNMNDDNTATKTSVLNFFIMSLLVFRLNEKFFLLGDAKVVLSNALLNTEIYHNTVMLTPGIITELLISAL